MRCLKTVLAIVGFVIIVSQSAHADAVVPAPNGEPAVVAQQVIHYNFDKSMCPLVVDAKRYGDGTIAALCNNGERFRIFGISGYPDPVAMKCSAAEAFGIPGC